jgi:hypothetical protein
VVSRKPTRLCSELYGRDAGGIWRGDSIRFRVRRNQNCTPDGNATIRLPSGMISMLSTFVWFHTRVGPGEN